MFKQNSSQKYKILKIERVEEWDKDMVNLERALQIFNYKSSSEIRREELKKKYRYLIKTNHPDSTKNPAYRVQDIREALETIERYCEFVSSYRNKEFKPRFLDIDSLIDLYKNKKTVYNGEKFDRADLKKGNIFLDICYKIVIDGLTDNKNEYIFYNVQDQYRINIDVPVTEKSEHTIEFELNNKTKEVKLCNTDVNFKLSFDYNIEFVVHLHRKVLHEEKNDAKK